VDVALLVEHFARIVKAEKQKAEPEALALIARAAEGSVRDGLSILDQALAHGSGKVKAADVLAMLGLADRGRIYDLLDAVLSGKPKEAIAFLEGLHADGADPLQIVSELAEAVHAASRIKVAGEDAASALSASERARAAATASRLPLAALARAWQMLLKGHDEVARAPRAITATEMLLIRLSYAANLPPPEDLIRRLTQNPDIRTNREQGSNESQTLSNVPDSSGAPQARFAAGGAGGADFAPLADEIPVVEALLETAVCEAPLAPKLDSFADVVALAAERRDVRLKLALEDDVELVRFKPGHIELHLLANASKTLTGNLSRRLREWTGERWIVSITEERGEKPLGEVRREREARMKEEARRHPTVQQVLRIFPDAEITAVRELDDEAKSGNGSEKS
jgi:DNA polymerase-3 subunit gamma/tau